MKQNNTTRIFYTILVPVILLVALMNSGFLQARLPAVTIDGTGYNISQFNFYYFTLYQEYLAENFDENGENGPFDTSTNLRDQYREDGTSWKEYFIQEALAWMSEVVYYDTLADAAGYTFSDEELAPVQTQLDYIETARAANSISLKNYLVAYWGVGMTQAVYTQELTRATRASAYQSYLAEQYTPQAEEISAWLAENPLTDYQIANLQIITLDATTDRATGQVGSAQLEGLQQRLSQLVERYENGTSFADLQAAFSTCQLGDAEGNLTALDATDLPQALVDWCLATEECLTEGDTLSFVDEEAGLACFVYFVGYAGSSAQYTAEQAVSLQAVQDAATQDIAAIEVTQNSLFMRLAAS